MFNIRLKEVRLDLGLTQQFVADLLGVTLRQYQRYESGDSEPTLAGLNDIAIGLNISIDYLIGLADSRKGYLGNEVSADE